MTAFSLLMATLIGLDLTGIYDMTPLWTVLCWLGLLLSEGTLTLTKK